jgi:TolB-like protein
MKTRSLFCIAAAAVLLGSCASTSVREYTDIDTLIEEAAWEGIYILWENYEDLDSAEDRVIAVYYFTEDGDPSPLNDVLIEGLTTSFANAILDEGIKAKMVSRSNLDKIIEELAFQSSDLADQDNQLTVGKQLGAQIILTGTVSRDEYVVRFNFQLLDVETSAVLGGFFSYLYNES